MKLDRFSKTIIQNSRNQPKPQNKGIFIQNKNKIGLKLLEEYLYAMFESGITLMISLFTFLQ